jgi:hypothetical protein
MASIPIPVSVICDVAGNQPDLIVSWSDLDSEVKRVLVGVFETGLATPAFSLGFASAPGTNTVAVKVTATLTPAKAYEVRFAREESRLVWSTGLPLLFVAPSSLTVDAGEGGLTVQWTNSGGTKVAAGQFLVSTATASNGVLGPLSTAPNWGFIPIALPIALPPPIRIKVRPLAGGAPPSLAAMPSLGPPSAEVTLVQNTYSASRIDNGGANPRIVKVPRPSPATPARAFNVQLLENGVVVQTISATEEGADPELRLNFTAEPAAGKLYELTLQQKEGSASGPVGPRTPLVTAAPLPLSVVRTAPDAVAYRTQFRGLPLPTALEVNAGASPLVMEGASGSVSAGASAASVTFRAVVPLPNGLSLGPAVTTRIAPSVTSAITDPFSGTTTLFWEPVDGAASYLVQLYGSHGMPAGAPIAAATTTLLLPLPLLPGAQGSVAIAAVTGGGPEPFGERFPLPAARPSDVRVSFDGTTAAVSWTPVGGASGYQITVLDDTETPAAAVVVGPVSDTTLDLSALPTSGIYSVTVQALFGPNSGPPTDPLPLFEAGYFIGTPASIRPATTLALEPEALSVFLPQLGGITGVTLPVGTSPFRLEASGSAELPFRLVIPADGLAWTFTDAPIRAELQTAYRDFLSAAEAAGVTPWGITLLQQAISRAMPQTFVESLYYAYGLSMALQAPSGAGYADLRPGMVLRVASADFLDPAVTPPPPHLAGFMPGGYADYDVSSLSTGPGTPWTAGFDAFLGQLVANGILAVTPPPGAGANEGGMADAADLLFPEFRQPFYRLFFPATLQSPSGPGSSLTAQNFAIASARTYDILQLTRNTPVPGAPVAYFRGRTIVRLCIRVFVNGSEQVVPIGTTVGNLLERYAAQAPAAALHIGGLRMTRARGLVVVEPESAGAGASYPVRFDWKTQPVYGAAYDALSLPLLHGDHVTFGG